MLATNAALPSLSVLLMMLCAAIVLALGSAHLVLTFRGSALHPRDPGLRAAMARAQPRLTADTTMWSAWIGFNASHSIGAMLFALVYGYLALVHAPVLFGSLYLRLLGGAVLAAYLVLGWRYWFSIPFRGIALAGACYFASVITAAAASQP